MYLHLWQHFRYQNWPVLIHEFESNSVWKFDGEKSLIYWNRNFSSLSMRPMKSQFKSVILTQFWVWEQAGGEHFQCTKLWDELEFGEFQVFFAIHSDDIPFSSGNWCCVGCNTEIHIGLVNMQSHAHIIVPAGGLHCGHTHLLWRWNSLLISISNCWSGLHPNRSLPHTIPGRMFSTCMKCGCGWFSFYAN